MAWIAAAIVCGYLGWQGAAFFRWPLAICVFGAVAGSALVAAYHRAGFGPSLEQKMLNVMLTWLVLQPAAYLVGVGMARARDAWRSR
jgi:hypothetical protein